MSENPLVISDLLSGGHVTRYGRHFEKPTVLDTHIGSSSSKQNYVLLIIRFSGLGSSLMTLDVMSDDHVTGYAAIFWRKNMKNYNLLLVNWKILNVIITYTVFVVEKSIGDVKFAVRLVIIIIIIFI